jgi:hypothetical protein
MYNMPIVCGCVSEYIVHTLCYPRYSYVYSYKDYVYTFPEV